MIAKLITIINLTHKDTLNVSFLFPTKGTRQTMNRQEHLDWCKTRAIDLANSGNINEALASMVSDLNKHEETREHPATELGIKLAITGNLKTKEEMINFINGFN